MVTIKKKSNNNNDNHHHNNKDNNKYFNNLVIWLCIINKNDQITEPLGTIKEDSDNSQSWLDCTCLKYKY